MPMTDVEIKNAYLSGSIVIDPFNEDNLGTDTYDVRLGRFFYREQGDEIRQLIFDPFDERSVSTAWGEPQEAADSIIWLEPGETILAHTEEFIGARVGATTKMFARSTVGRSMLGVCKCAGRGDVGYFNRWTMEITSFSRFHRIPLRVGTRIAQIEFSVVGDTDKVYGKTHGKYQQGANLAELKRDWEPKLMLPRMYKDTDR
jgi:dCTP deaminase